MRGRIEVRRFPLIEATIGVIYSHPIGRSSCLPKYLSLLLRFPFFYATITLPHCRCSTVHHQDIAEQAQSVGTFLVIDFCSYEISP